MKQFFLNLAIGTLLSNSISAQDVTSTQLQQQIDRLSQNLSALESSGFAYEPEIAEVLMDLAFAYREAGFYDAALIHYQRALHIERINRGLWDTSLIPLYFIKLETLLESKNSRGFTQVLQQLTQVILQNTHLVSEAYLADLDRVARWHLAAYQQSIDDVGIAHLLDAHKLFTLLSHTEQLDVSQRLQALQGVLNTVFFLLIEDLQLSGLQQGLDSGCELPPNVRSVSVAFATDSRYNTCITQIIRRIDMSVSLIQQWSSDEASDAERRVLGWVYLGDLYLILGKTKEAQSYFEKAWQEAERRCPDCLDFLRSPVSMSSEALLGEIPDLQQYGRPATNQLMSVKVQLDITERGSIKNVLLRESSTSFTEETRRSAIQQVYWNHYRPALQEGNIIPIQGVVETVEVWQ